MADTIFALSSGRGRAGVAVFRVSGPDAAAAGERLLRRPLPEARRARLAWIHDPEDDGPLDQALVLWFPGPRSFTGEDVLELHVHGGTGVIAAVTRALQALPGLRLAEPGEFSRRAFLNGRFDLTAAEGLADLINAETDAQRRQALGQMAGRAAAVYDAWRQQLVSALAMIEVDIDFADEDLPEDVAARAAPLVDALMGEMRAALADERRGERLRDGLTVAIVGPPNVGKSSLLNALARREAAIVSDIAGTTRDVIEVHMDLGGWPVTLLDTAGLRDSADVIEREGIARARARAQAADLRLVMIDARDWPALPAEVAALLDDNSMRVANKADLSGGRDGGTNGWHFISVRDGQGLDRLVAEIERRAEALLGGREAVLITRARHRAAVEEALVHLERFTRALGRGELELLAEDLRLAARALGRITGRIEVDDILDVIFSEFCIGK